MNGFSFGEKRISTLLAIGMLFVLLAGLTLATKNVGQIKTLFSFAQGDVAPQGGVGVANISESSFTAYWFTDKETSGGIFYGTTSSLEGGVAVDERDLASPNGKYKTHFVRVSGLAESTKYYFKVGSTAPSFGDPAKNQAPYEVTTGPKISATQTVDPIYGQANSSSGSPATGALALWQSASAAPLVALTKSDGNYVVPIGNARTQDLTAAAIISPGTNETITINDGSGETATIACASGSDRPLPTIKIGQNLNCSLAAAEPALAPTPGATGSARFKAHSGSFSSFTPSSGTLQLTNVAPNQSISTAFPTFSGKSGPNQLVKIVIHSDTTYSGTVIAGPDGSWSWTPPAGLTPGEHTVVITVVNPDGTTQTVTRNFTVTAGGPILPVTFGTPAAQLSVTPTPTPEASPTASPLPPVTGNSSQTQTLLIVGAIFLFSSFVLISRLANLIL